MRLHDFRLAVRSRGGHHRDRRWQGGRGPRLRHSVRHEFAVSAAAGHAAVLLRLAVHDCVAEHPRRRVVVLIGRQFGLNRRLVLVFLLDERAVQRRLRRVAVDVVMRLRLMHHRALVRPALHVAVRGGAPVAVGALFRLHLSVGHREPPVQLGAEVLAELPAVRSLPDQGDAVVLVERQLVLARRQVGEQGADHWALVVLRTWRGRNVATRFWFLSSLAMFTFDNR